MLLATRGRLRDRRTRFYRQCAEKADPVDAPGRNGQCGQQCQKPEARSQKKDYRPAETNPRTGVGHDKFLSDEALTVVNLRLTPPIRSRPV
jgi:hypothetical protein